MIALKDEITMELEKISQDKFAEIYDVIHFFRLGIENERKVVTRKEWGQAFLPVICNRTGRNACPTDNSVDNRHHLLYSLIPL